MEKPGSKKNMLVVAINMAILISYVIGSRIWGGDGVGFILVAFFIALHFILCLFFALFPAYRKGFLLSAAAVVLIGFSTCYLAYAIH